MGEELKASRELEGLKREMDKLAQHLEADVGDIESEVVSGILHKLSEGETATSIINEFGLVSETETEGSV